MDERILEFIGDLRRAEMRISPSEALDALSATTEIGLHDRETFKAALASTLVNAKSAAKACESPSGGGFQKICATRIRVPSK